jgi:DNA-binding IclR family transcriptional regulator
MIRLTAHDHHRTRMLTAFKIALKNLDRIAREAVDQPVRRRRQPVHVAWPGPRGRRAQRRPRAGRRVEAE